MPYLERPSKPRLHYLIDDFTDPWLERPTLLLQHGYSRSARIWYSWIPYLARHYRVVRMDLRGLGQSSKDFDLTKELSADHHVEDLLALIKELGDRPVHYCGESLGGIIGVVLAALHPEKLRTLSLVAAPLGIPSSTKEQFAFGYPSWAEAVLALGSEGWSAKVNSAVRFPPDSDPAMLAWYAAETGKSDKFVLAELSKVATSVDITPYLSKIVTPTLGLYPSGGKITARDEGAVERSIAGIRYVKLPTPCHAIQFLEPAACAKAVLHFASQFDGFSPHE